MYELNETDLDSLKSALDSAEATIGLLQTAGRVLDYYQSRIESIAVAKLRLVYNDNSYLDSYDIDEYGIGCNMLLGHRGEDGSKSISVSFEELLDDTILERLAGEQKKKQELAEITKLQKAADQRNSAEAKEKAQLATLLAKYGTPASE